MLKCRSAHNWSALSHEDQVPFIWVMIKFDLNNKNNWVRKVYNVPVIRIRATDPRNRSIQFLAHVDRGSQDQTACHYSYSVHFSYQCWLTAYHNHVKSKKSDFHGVSLQAGLRRDTPILNYRLVFLVSATAWAYASTFTKVCLWLGEVKWKNFIRL